MITLVRAIVFFGTIFLVLGCSNQDTGVEPELGGKPQLINEELDNRDISVARRWNEVVLEAVRNDYARPTVHARNLYHISIAMYDSWAAYSDVSRPFLLGNALGDFSCDFDQSVLVGDRQIAREQALSYAVYRLIEHRFNESPGIDTIVELAEELMAELDLDSSITSRIYTNGSAIGLGNHIADCIIQYGFQDSANEQSGYANKFYVPENPGLNMSLPGNPEIVDFNRWQPLIVEEFIDQSGNVVSGGAGTFLSPEWGQVEPFALNDMDRVVYQREGFDYQVYHDPGMPPIFGSMTDQEYKWGFALVAKWSSHLSPVDGEMMDISPASIGNIQNYPSAFSEYDQFYNELLGGDSGQGYDSNPVTGQAYVAQMVPRGDYARVLAEFWADGPNSETPPGHWFVILNDVNDNIEDKRFEGLGSSLGSLEWDVKAYFMLGGAMHDSAIAAWGIKGWYDYIRPVSAIRAMASLGQSSDPEAPSYNIGGIPLHSGLIELVGPGDDLLGVDDAHLNKIKLFGWRGPDYIEDPGTSEAGVGWILAQDWWPYQRPSFVTPPFAGYVSGHSTYSRAAAEVLSALTGSEYFPGGMSSFEVKANEFLVFEQGPSVDMTLQWAKYRDASDQCSLSRIWGGIHPPADDIPGRIIGEKIGADAFSLAKKYINGVAH